MPFYMNGGGDLSVPSLSTGGDDLYAIATGNISLGEIDTTGDSRTGIIWVLAGISDLYYEGNPVTDEMIITCTSCAPVLGDETNYTLPSNGIGTGDISISGTLTASGLQFNGASITSSDGVITVVNPGAGLGGMSFKSTGIVSFGGDLNLEGSLAAGPSPTSQFTVDGDVTCSYVEVGITGSINITGTITVTDSNDGALMLLSAGAFIEPYTESTITIGGDITVPGGFIVLEASGDISAGTVSNSADSSTGGEFGNPQTIKIMANIAAWPTADTFVIGGSGSNGVAAISNTSNTGSTGADGVRCVYIFNGPGDITIEDASVISVGGTSCNSAYIILDGTASGGTNITINGGTLSTDNSGGYNAGNISLLAGNVINLTNGAAISASDNGTGSGTTICLCAASLTYDSGAAIHCDGDNASRAIWIVTPGSQTVPDLTAPNPTVTAINPTQTELEISGSEEFDITANGLYGTVSIYGTPLTFDNSDAFDITANGQYPTIFVESNGDVSYSGEGTISLNADSPFGDSNGIFLYTYTLVETNSPMVLSANAYGNTGSIIMGGYGTDWTAPLSCSVNNLGSGNGGVINISALNSLIPPTLNLSANGGTDGDGGKINLDYIGAITFDGSVVAKGQGSGDGGQISVIAYSITGTGTDDYLNVDALGDGNGGTISIDTNNNDITIGGGSSPLTLSAQSLGAGNGGTISVITDNPGNVFVQTASLTAQALGTGNGGSIVINTNSNGDVNLDTATLLVTATSGETPGSITLNGNNINFTTSGELNADCGQAGGQISLVTQTGDINIGSGGDAIPLSAQALSSGNGGTISLTSAGNVNLNPANLMLNGGNSGNGGTLTINAVQSFNTAGTVAANGQGSGTGGILSLTANDFTFFDTATINAIGGSSGNGGSLSFTQNNTATDTTDLSQLNVYVDGGTDSGDGGDLTISYAASNLNIGGISSTSPSEGDAGSITISSTTDTDVSIQINGDIQTFTQEIESVADLDEGNFGSFTINPFDPSSNNISLTVNSTGGFSSNLSATGASITVNCEPVVTLVTGTITANSGDINISADADDEARAANWAKKGKKQVNDDPPPGSIIAIDDVWTAVGGRIFGTASDFFVEDSPTPNQIIMIPGTPGDSLTITCNNFNFGNNTYIYGAAVGGDIMIKSDSALGLTIYTPGPNTLCGFQSANSISLEALNGPLQITTLSDFPSEQNLVMQGQGSCSLISNYSITVNIPLGLPLSGTSVPDPSNCANSIEFNTTSDITLVGSTPIWALQTLIINGATVTCGSMYVGSSTSPGSITVTASTADISLVGNVVCQGPVSMTSPTLIGSNGPITALSNGTIGASTISLNAPNIDIEQSLTAAGEIDIFTGSTINRSYSYPDYIPDSIQFPDTQITVGPSNTIYWGPPAGFDIPEDLLPTFTATGYNIVFDAEGAGEITVYNVAIKAST